MGTDPRNGFLLFRYPLGIRRRSLRCAFHCRAAHGGYDVLGGCTLVAGTVFGLSFPETLRGGASPPLWAANFSKHCVQWELSVVDTVSARVWLVVVDLKPRTDKPGDR